MATTTATGKEIAPAETHGVEDSVLALMQSFSLDHNDEEVAKTIPNLKIVEARAECLLRFCQNFAPTFRGLNGAMKGVASGLAKDLSSTECYEKYCEYQRHHLAASPQIFMLDLLGFERLLPAGEIPAKLLPKKGDRLSWLAIPLAAKIVGLDVLAAMVELRDVVNKKTGEFVPECIVSKSDEVAAEPKTTEQVMNIVRDLDGPGQGDVLSVVPHVLCLCQSVALILEKDESKDTKKTRVMVQNMFAGYLIYIKHPQPKQCPECDLAFTVSVYPQVCLECFVTTCQGCHTKHMCTRTVCPTCNQVVGQKNPKLCCARHVMQKVKTISTN